MMEQIPKSSDFAVVTQQGVSPLMALEAAETVLYDIPFYKGMVDPVILLTEAANVLSASSGRKFIVLSSTMRYNNGELENKIRELALQGIDVRVVAFEADTGRHRGDMCRRLGSV
jgi:hypothetical protein